MRNVSSATPLHWAVSESEGCACIVCTSSVICEGAHGVSQMPSPSGAISECARRQVPHLFIVPSQGLGVACIVCTSSVNCEGAHSVSQMPSHSLRRAAPLLWTVQRLWLTPPSAVPSAQSSVKARMASQTIFPWSSGSSNSLRRWSVLCGVRAACCYQW